MKIRVTQNDIERGVRRDRFCCPVAIALKRQCPGKSVNVGKETVTLYGADNTEDAFQLPETACYQINIFDITGRMLPFEFELGAPING